MECTWIAPDELTHSELVKKEVLVVEDDRDLREMIQWLLEEEGFVVKVARNGKEALDYAVVNKPSLVLLDMTLPIIDGFGVAAGLHKVYGDQLPILTMTADGHADEKACKIGAIGCISKPFELDALVDAVRAALER
jgi:two-component system chemotaxis response regulator CheY